MWSFSKQKWLEPKSVGAIFRRLALHCGLALAMASPLAAAPASRFDHLYVIVLENHGFDDGIANGPLPFVKKLAEEQGVATFYFGIAHPSLPNYLAMIGGDDFGVRDDQPSCYATHIAPSTPCHKIEGDSLVDQLEKAGLTFALYAESLPKTGDLVHVAPNEPGGAIYAQKHNPFAYFTQIATNPARLARLKNFDALAADLAAGTAPNFALIVPNQCHDGHGLAICHDRDGLTRDYDAFVREAVTMIRTSSSWTDRSAIVITFDESANSLYPEDAPSDIARHAAGIDNHVATLVVTRCGQPHQDATRFNHFSLLATIEDGFGLPRLRKAGDAAAMTGLFEAACSP